MAYCGESRASKTIARAHQEGLGVVVQRGRVRLARIDRWRRWFYDNKAFSDFNSGVASDFDVQWRDEILWILDQPDDRRPDFAVLPDIVAGGLESLGLSLSWLHRLGRTSIKWALAVQDGMTSSSIPWDAPFDVIFVGGSIDWKLATMSTWARVAHEHGRLCHVGRMGSGRRVRMAKGAGADSIDSALMLWSKGKFNVFSRAMADMGQTKMFEVGGP